jgi:hypothetical protein
LQGPEFKPRTAPLPTQIKKKFVFASQVWGPNLILSTTGEKQKQKQKKHISSSSWNQISMVLPLLNFFLILKFLHLI